MSHQCSNVGTLGVHAAGRVPGQDAVQLRREQLPQGLHDRPGVHGAAAVEPAGPAQAAAQRHRVALGGRRPGVPLSLPYLQALPRLLPFLRCAAA